MGEQAEKSFRGFGSSCACCAKTDCSNERFKGRIGMFQAQKGNLAKQDNPASEPQRNQAQIDHRL